MPKLRLAAAFAVMLTTSVAATAGGARALASSDPSSNFAVNPSCPTPATCLRRAIGALDEARARLRQPVYRLPGNFPRLSAPEQAFVLTNLDRTLYGLKPITGLTAGLDAVAAAAVRMDRDPVPGAADLTGIASNWGGGYSDMPLAYGAWMYDDGPGGANLDCLTATASGCWAHRHNVLWRLSGRGPVAMGAAAGTDQRGARGYAMLLVQGGSGYRPDYLYTWTQAVAAGAGSIGSDAAPPRSGARAALIVPRITMLRIHGHTVSFRVLARRGVVLSCSLAHLAGNGTEPDRRRRCRRSTTYSGLHSGRYRLRVQAARRVTTSFFAVS